MNLARPNQKGTFLVNNLPAGDYYAAAVDWVQGSETDGEWQSKEFLQSIASQASRVKLGEAQRVTLSPRLILR